jgi:alpha-L-fucosidase
VLREIANECQRQDLLFGTYYSVIDSYAFGWDHVPHPPDPRPNPPIRGGIRSYVPFLVAQCDELIDRYGSKILWFDMSSAIDAWTPEIGAEVYEHFNRKDDTVLMNSRLDNGVRGPERAQPRTVAQRAGDFETREQEIGTFTETPWENCAPMTDNWSWHAGDRAKSLRASIDLLLACVGGNGNFLYNFSPGPDGAIEPDQIQLMRDMGAWLARNGRSIYGTRGGPYRPAAGFVSTRMGSTVFLHLFKGQAEAAVPALPGRKLLAAKLIGGEPLAWRQEGGRYQVKVDPARVEELDTIIELTFDGDVMSAPIQTV